MELDYEVLWRVLHRAKVLVFSDDEQAIAEAEALLVNLGAQMLRNTDVQQSVDLLDAGDSSLALVDIDCGLPGLRLVRQLRNQNRKVRLVVFGTRPVPLYAVELLNLGLSGYVLKPTDQERLARAMCHAAVEIDGGLLPSCSLAPGWSYDRQNRVIRHDDELVDLTNQEASLLEVLLDARGRIVSHVEISERVWEHQSRPMSADALKALVQRLRSKLPQGALRNRYGHGYALQVMRASRYQELRQTPGEMEERAQKSELLS